MCQATDLTDSWIIISDLHLGGFDHSMNSAIMQDFTQVVNYAKENSSGLIINGDLFDYYMEYSGSVPPVVEEGVSTLKDYVNTTKLSPIYISGNHDNWDDGYLESHGLKVIHEEFITTMGNKNIFIAHGDGLNDLSYGLPRPLMHRFLRNPAFIKIFKLITTVKTGNWIMKWFSRINRRFDSDNAGATKRIDVWATNMLETSSFDVIITAHHHHSRFLKFKNKLYLNSGCFYKDRTAILYTNNGFELVKWDNQTQTFIPIQQGNLE